LIQSSAPLLISAGNKASRVQQQGPVAKDDVTPISGGRDSGATIKSSGRRGCQSGSYSGIPRAARESGFDARSTKPVATTVLRRLR